MRMKNKGQVRDLNKEPISLALIQFVNEGWGKDLNKKPISLALIQFFNEGQELI